MRTLEEQYIYVQEARSILLDYCQTITPDHLLFENPSFGHGGSIRNLLVHIANCYQAWIGNRILEKRVSSLQFEDYCNMRNIITLFATIDNMMTTFFEHFGDITEQISFEKDGHRQCTTSYKIFSHVITHEFHHKGQILSMSRQLGYTPVDTDIMQ